MRDVIIKTNGGEIVVLLNNVGGGKLESSLKECCPHCERDYCGDKGDFCHSASEKIEIGDLDLEDVSNRLRWNRAVDAIESMILAHACDGIDVGSESYVNGVNNALDAISNHSD